jgi:hypothetical protein
MTLLEELGQAGADALADAFDWVEHKVCQLVCWLRGHGEECCGQCLRCGDKL